MSLVVPLTEDQAPLLVRPFFAGGDPGPITATLAQVPELVEVSLAFIGAVLSPSGIDVRTKEIVILRTSALLACRYCVDSHTPVALDAGLSHDEVRALRQDSIDAIERAFPAACDRALIAWVDAVATGRGAIAPAIGEALARHTPEHEIVELTLLVGTTMLLNRYATALSLPVGEGTIARLAAEGFGRTP